MKAIFTVLIFIAFNYYSSAQIKEQVEKQYGPDIEVKVGEVFTISFKSNPTTGYSWVLCNSKQITIVDSLSVKFIPDDASANIVGVGGNSVWTFKGLRLGVQTLTFHYKRSWEKVLPAETASFVVRVAN